MHRIYAEWIEWESSKAPSALGCTCNEVAAAQERVAATRSLTLDAMKNRQSKTSRRARQEPLDHLRPGSPARTEADDSSAPKQAPERPFEGAEPAEPVTPGAGDAEAARGKATRSPAAAATRRHLEGSEQGPQ
jgi:hypothetical protein